MEWTHLTTVSDQMNAELLVQALRDEEIEAIVNPGDTAGFLGVTPKPCRVMVADVQWPRAIALLDQWRSGAAKSSHSMRTPSIRTKTEESARPNPAPSRRGSRG